MKAKSFFLVAAFVATISFPLSAKSQLTLKQRIERIEQQNITRSQLQSEMSIQLIALQKEVRELVGLVEENGFKLKQIQDRQRDLYRDIENRLANPSQTASSANTSSSKTKLDRKNTNRSAQKSTVKKGERAEFEAAFKLVRTKKYDEAIIAFEIFSEKYPRGNFSDNAQFWIGQIYFAQSKLPEAEKQFNLFREKFPDSSKSAAVLLSLAKIKRKQQKWQEAKDFYNQVINNYTGAQQQLARKGLEDIKKLGH